MAHRAFGPSAWYSSRDCGIMCVEDKAVEKSLVDTVPKPAHPAQDADPSPGVWDDGKSKSVERAWGSLTALPSCR